MVTENKVAAVSEEDGTELWTEIIDHTPPVALLSVGTDRLLVQTLSAGDDGEVRTYYTFDLKTGEMLWEKRFGWVGSMEHMKHTENRVYDTGEGLLRALDATDGTKLWTADIGERIRSVERLGERIRSVEIAGAGTTDELLIRDSGDHLHKVTSDGDVTGSKSIPELGSLFIRDPAYVSDRDRVYRFDLDTLNHED